MNEIESIPLFPLGVVILPEMSLPLHIFEDRYKQMISECLARKTPFGIVLFDGQHMLTVGCTARVTEVIKRYSDGRMDILTRGEKRFVIERVINEKPYLEAHVSFFEDRDNPNPDDMKPQLEQIRDLLGELYEMDPPSHQLNLLRHADPVELSFAIAGMEGFTPSERQRFLEMTSTFERIEKGARALSKLVQRTRLTKEINTIIGGNGSPPQELIQRAASKERIR